MKTCTLHQAQVAQEKKCNLHCDSLALQRTSLHQRRKACAGMLFFAALIPVLDSEFSISNSSR
jgi:hypothetical protein